MTDWTPEEDETLRRCRAEGMSYGDIEIAGVFQGKSRNAIIGRGARIGLSEKLGPRALRPPRPRKMSDMLPRVKAARRRPVQPSLFDRIEVLPIPDLPADYSDCAINFFETSQGDGKCRYPIGEPSNLYEFRFCGAVVFDEHPYCARHCRITYRKPDKPGGTNERSNGNAKPREKSRAA